MAERIHVIEEQPPKPPVHAIPEQIGGCGAAQSKAETKPQVLHAVTFLMRSAEEAEELCRRASAAETERRMRPPEARIVEHGPAHMAGELKRAGQNIERLARIITLAERVAEEHDKRDPDFALILRILRGENIRACPKCRYPMEEDPVRNRLECAACGHDEKMMSDEDRCPARPGEHAARIGGVRG